MSRSDVNNADGSISLHQLQNQFAKALHYQAKGEDCHIISDQFSADERMQIYRNNFIISLSEVLEATYPMLHALVGEECFNQVARQHVLSHPLTEGNVTYYGEHFEQTLQQFEAVIEAAPYCVEVAKFEWACDVSQQRFSVHSADGLIPLAHLANIDPSHHGEIRFHLRPDVQLFSSHFAVYSLQAAISSGEFDGLDIHQPEQGLVACHIDGSPWSLELSKEAFQLIEQLQQQKTLGEIPPDLLSELNQVIELGIVAGLTMNEHHH